MFPPPCPVVAGILEPVLDTVYVLRQYRGRGVRCRLAEQGLLWFKERGVQKMACDVQSPEMWSTLQKLVRLRPDVAALVKDSPGFKPTDGVEIRAWFKRGPFQVTVRTLSGPAKIDRWARVTTA